MAKLVSPLLNLRGTIGDLVFRILHGETIVSRHPGKQNKQKESLLQATNRKKFKNASAQAKLKLRNPEVKAYYEHEAQRLKLPNAYTAALRAELKNFIHPSTHSPDSQRLHE